MTNLFSRLGAPVLTDDQKAALRASTVVNSAGYDPWGLNLETAERSVRYLQWLYRDYFRVEAVGLHNVPAGRVLLTSNHSGQLPLDGILIGLAMMLDADPPRVVRGMVARWFPRLPFIGTWFIRCGQVVGDPDNCIELLENEQAIMLFPEGESALGKPYRDRYNLGRFGTGFVRIALETGAPIVPVAVIGAEEIYPSLHNFPWLSKQLGLPYITLTPFFPLLGPLGLVPLPHRIQIRFGEPIHLEGSEDASDADVNAMVRRVRRAVEALIDAGLDERPHLRPANPRRESAE
ncbi:MAG: 1-acyl-sn-glycerol-3-phosphate acyltransferase [Myxococcota bacterium]|jgi:1-acyl-sn-glycerol-3-phosphate acyltransferase